MFDYKATVTDDELNMVFKKISPTEYSARLRGSQDEVDRVVLDNCVFNTTLDETTVQFKLWRTRPERAIGKKVKVVGETLESLIDKYEELLFGSLISVSKASVDASIIQRFGSALEWLRTTDFYTAPASSKYHDSFRGGLLTHTLNVYNKMLELIEIDSFSTVDIAEATLACLTHDWCKIRYYEMYLKNVKDEQTGQWTKQEAYTVNQTGAPLGHGTTSMFLASRFIHLPLDLALAIRWHMGRWHTSENEENELQLANSRYPLVYLVQFADQLACTEY